MSEVGLIFDILALPVRGPIQAVTWIARNVAQEAERDLYDEEKIRTELAEIEMRYELGEIGDEEYAQAEDALLERLRVAQERMSEPDEEETEQ